MEASATGASPVLNATQLSKFGFIGRFFRLAGPYWRSDQKLKAWGLTAGLVVLTMAQVTVPIAVNQWSQRLFDALEQRSVQTVLLMVGMLGCIMLGNMVVTTLHLNVKRNLQLGWRRWLTKTILDDWMRDGRHYQVTHMPGEHDNPDGRIAEDIRITTEYAVALFHSLLYCLLLLISFTEILWTLSGPAEFSIGAYQFYIPGHLVWIALLYAAVCTSIALLLGRPLVWAANKRQTFEANYRFGLMRARENSEAIALIHGDSDERRRFVDLFRGVAEAWDRQTRALTHISLFTAGYSVLSNAFPVLVASPRYIAGTISLGVLMQTAQAFQQMEGALSWPIDNMALGADWKASVERILGLRTALSQLEEEVTHGDGERILVATADRPALLFQDVSIANPDGQLVIHGFSAEIGHNERVLISGDPGAAIKLFKVVAGLWPWGRGRVELPNDASIFFMPQRPYLPIGSLRNSLIYPAAPKTFDDVHIMAALEAVGMAQLTGRLDERQSWEKVLTAGELQRLGFARLLLHRPNWIFIQEATDGLDPDGEEDMLRLLQAEFPTATVITVGYHKSLEAYHQRKLIILKSADGVMLIEDRRKKDRKQIKPPGTLYSQLVRVLQRGLQPDRRAESG
jgi:putative ATP-binding cassette transporter